MRNDGIIIKSMGNDKKSQNQIQMILSVKYSCDYCFLSLLPEFAMSSLYAMIRVSESFDMLLK